MYLSIKPSNTNLMKPAHKTQKNGSETSFDENEVSLK